MAHPLPQVILADLWMGGLRMRKNPGFKIFFGIWIPPLIPFLEFKTKEELELMPQTEEELQDRDDSDSNSSGIFLYRLCLLNFKITLLWSAQGQSRQTVFFELALRDRNVQVRFCLKVVLNNP